jgi:anti-anti-sigma regulatory factor
MSDSTLNGAMPLVRLRTSGATCVIEFTCVVDVQAAGELQREMLAFGITGGDVTLDWSKAERVDLSVIQLLLAFRAAPLSAGRAFWVSGDNPNIREYLRIAGLSCHFPEKAPVQ